MPEPIRLIRLPIDTNCSDCKRPLSFGIYGYFNADSQDALCIGCGVKRGWCSKDRALNIVKKLELTQDLKALRDQAKIEADALLLVRQQIDLHRIGENDALLERQMLSLIDTANDYLHHVATEPEKEALKKLLDTIQDAQKLQQEIREQVQSRFFFLERLDQKRKRKIQPIIPSEE
jgi:hypothetical protein